MNGNTLWPENIVFFCAKIVLYFVVQAPVLVAHEFAHSTTAWLLGYTSTPFTVILGNPITILGWDEGVPYDQLFGAGGKAAEAAIGGMPLLMHTVFIVFALIALQRMSTAQRKWIFCAIYWFLIVNLTELVAYIWMRPFISTGDTGRFNQGLNLSPVDLFVGGTIFLFFSFTMLRTRVMLRLDRVLEGIRMRIKFFVYTTAFITFLWGSGLRIMTLYPDRQWRWGLIGVVAAPVWVLANRTSWKQRPSYS